MMMNEVENSVNGDGCNSGDGDSSSESEWEGVDSETEDCSKETTCLFCTEMLSSQEAVFHHCLIQHSFDFVAFAKRNSLDAVAYIKLINYIRLNKPSVADIEQKSADQAWTSDSFMKPTNPEDPLLTFDIESYMEEQCVQNEHIEGSNETITVSKSEHKSLLAKLAQMEAQLNNAWDRIERMKETAKTVLCSAPSQIVEKKPDDRKEELDNYYFSSYDHFGIHHEMLQDKIRTMAYHDAILCNKDVFSGKKVMDVGCGTAILSMFSAKAGASKVLAVEKSDVIYQAMDIIRENQFDDKIDLFRGRVEDAAIPEDSVDILVSEWMGYFLLFEGMLDSVLYARDRYLKIGGLMFPNRCTLSMAAVSDQAKYDEYVTFWNNVYGFKMSVMKRELIKEAIVESVNENALCSTPVVMKEFDLLTCAITDLEFVSKFDLTITKDCNVTSLVGFFDCMFDQGLTKTVTLSTSPLSAATHWKQTIFLFPEPIAVKAGDVIPCRLSCRKNRRDPRTLIVKIDFGTAYNQYYLA